MESFTIALLVIISFLSFLWNYGRHKTTNRKLPPRGPIGLPFVGNALQLDPTGAHKTFTTWRHTYGNIFRIRLFGKEVVILNDYDSIHEMLVTKTLLFADRPYTYRGHEVFSAGNLGISFQNYSKKWEFRKKTVIKSLKAYGEGLKTIEDISVSFIGKMIQSIKHYSKSTSSVIDLKPFLHFCTAGIITSMMYGEEIDESQLLELLETERGMLKFLSAVGVETVLDIVPALQLLPIKAFREGARHCYDFSQWLLRRHKLQQQKRQEVKIKCMAYECDALYKAGKLTIEEVLGLSLDMVSAGFTTTSSSTYALFGILACNERIQEKLYNEIQSVTQGRDPALADRKYMPYVEAVILEMVRFTSLAPLLLPHVCTEGTLLGDFDIPKGTTVIANVWNLHHDEKYWDQPFAFIPERFLTPGGELVGVDHESWKYFMGFGKGRRSCPGEQFARNRIFLMVTYLVQKFVVKPKNEENFPDMNPGSYLPGLIMAPNRYYVIMEER